MVGSQREGQTEGPEEAAENAEPWLAAGVSVNLSNNLGPREGAAGCPLL